MFTIYPDFYNDFTCRAGSCRHSCCRGWEIDIDPATAQYYETLGGPVGEEIRRHTGKNEDGSFFRLTADSRCPFLQPDGLCRLILTLGEDSLCEICAMHPRFFTYLADAELAGLGLCCEESVALLLNRQRPLLFAIAEDDTRPGNTMDFCGLLQFLELPANLAELKPLPVPAVPYLKQVLALMKQTEPIDDEWTSLLHRLQNWLEAPAGLSLPPTAQLTKIYQYILYRQLQETTAVPPQIPADFAQLSTAFIAWTASITNDLPEAVRLWSAQIEYDTDNVQLLLQALSELTSEEKKTLHS